MKALINIEYQGVSGPETINGLEYKFGNFTAVDDAVNIMKDAISKMFTNEYLKVKPTSITATICRESRGNLIQIGKVYANGTEVIAEDIC